MRYGWRDSILMNDLTTDELTEKYIGVETEDDCPKCDAPLLRDSTGVVWCSYVHCTYSNDPGMTRFLEGLSPALDSEEYAND